jgi:hypothetical protein
MKIFTDIDDNKTILPMYSNSDTCKCRDFDFNKLNNIHKLKDNKSINQIHLQKHFDNMNQKIKICDMV